MTQEVNGAIKLFWRIHPKVYQWSGGRIGKKLMGMPVLLLTTIGRKSGLQRTKALTYLPHDDNFVVIASNLGQPHHPAWWLHLAADPNATVQVGNQQIAVRAREAEGDERAALWQAVIDLQDEYAQYENFTERRIPVVVLECI